MLLIRPPLNHIRNVLLWGRQVVVKLIVKIGVIILGIEGKLVKNVARLKHQNNN